MRQVRNGVRPAGAALFGCALALTLAGALFGGASRENPLRLAAVELMALPLLVLALRHAPPGRLARAGQVLLALAILVPLLQLIPLPPALWLAAPGRGVRAQALAAAGLPIGWAPLSLFPAATLGCALALAAPAAMFLASQLMAEAQRRRLAAVWLASGAVGLMLGAFQLVEPAGGPAYPYATTNLGSLVGLFANRNHEAGFLLALVPFAALLAAARPSAGAPRRRRDRGAAPRLAWAPVAAGLFGAVALVALGVVRSRAGVLLALPAVLGAFAVMIRERAPRPILIAGLAGAAASVLAVALFAAGPIVDRFVGQTGQEGRFVAAPVVVRAGLPFQPLGAGLGAFDRVYRAAEPLEMVEPAFFNHAHDDYLELWLEAGWAAVALIVLFLAWFAVAARRAWTRAGEGTARAGSVAILVLLAQSAVDYPLRTQTLACLFAFACGALAARPGERT